MERQADRVLTVSGAIFLLAVLALILTNIVPRINWIIFFEIAIIRYIWFARD